VLLGEEPRDVSGRDPAARDDDLADALPALVLLGERLLELRQRERAFAQQESAERYARRGFRRQPQGRDGGVCSGPTVGPYRNKVLRP
jgi:hypothetical protein